MLCYRGASFVKQRCDSFLCAPDGFISVHHLDTSRFSAKIAILRVLLRSSLPYRGGQGERPRWSSAEGLGEFTLSSSKGPDGPRSPTAILRVQIYEENSEIQRQYAGKSPLAVLSPRNPHVFAQCLPRCGALAYDNSILPTHPAALLLG